LKPEKADEFRDNRLNLAAMSEVSTLDVPLAAHVKED
jgi:hypothetical protein